MEKPNEMTIGRAVPLAGVVSTAGLPKFVDPRTYRAPDSELMDMLDGTRNRNLPPTYVPVSVKLLHPRAKLPEYAHDTDSCFDIFAVDYCELEPGDLAVIETGISIQAAPNWDFRVEDKSGLSRQGITVRGGVIDAGYTGAMSVVLVNEGYARYLVEPGDKVAQVRVQPRYRAVFSLVDELESRDRGDNGYGSTGLKARPQ